MNYFDLDTEISMFSSQNSTEQPSVTTVEEALEAISGGEYMQIVSKYRSTGDSSIKIEKIPTISFHGVFSGKRAKKNFSNPTGIIIVDLDDLDENKIPQIKEDIFLNIESCLSVFVSPSGNGLKCLYLVDSDMVTIDNYNKIGKEVAKKFSKYGKTDTLSITDCLIMTYDPELLINEEVVPDYYIKIDESVNKSDGTLEKRDESKALFDDPEDFFNKVLRDQIEERADNNFKFIQMSVYELAKFGFKHPQHDLRFVIDMSEDTFKPSSDNNRRFIEAVDTAKSVSQTRWAYDYDSSDDFEFEKLGGVGSSKSHKKGGINDEVGEDCEEVDEDEVDEDEVFYSDEDLGLIDYSTFMDEVESVINEGDRVGVETSLSNLNDIFRFGHGLLTITGIPTSGKTDLVDQILLDLSRINGWMSVVAGFEQREAEHVVKLMRKDLGFNISSKGADKGNKGNSYKYVTDNIKHINIMRTGGDIDKILKYFERIIKAYDPKCFVIDPFNLLTTKTKSSGHEKVGEILSKIVMFCKKHNKLLILVAHPYKMKKDEKTGKFEIPDFYSVKGSSAFFEMSYHGLVIHRDDDSETPVMVRVLKVKQNNLGTKDGEAFFKYHKPSGRFIPVTKDGVEIPSDRAEKNWHKKAVNYKKD